MKRLLVSFTVFFSLLISLSAEKIVFSATNMTGQAGNTNTKTSLSGNAYIKTETMEIHADSVDLSGDEYRFIAAEGHITGKNLETNMTFSCDSLNFDRITKVAELKGNVNFTDVENDVKAQAQVIIYNQKDETAVMQIKVNLTQKDNVCSGAYAVYYKTEQLLELSGNAQIRQNDDIFRAQHISLNMDTQEITLGGNVRGSVTDSKPSKKKDALPEEENVPDGDKPLGEGQVEGEPSEKVESEGEES